MVQSGPRKISATYNTKSINKQNERTTPNIIAKSEIDNHADTTCFGSNFTAVHVTKLMNSTAPGRNGRTGHEEVTGETPDISEYVDFDFYDWVWYWDTPDKDNSPKIGRWLGPSHRIGAAMCYYILV
jgi:hypothetical protein